MGSQKKKNARLPAGKRQEARAAKTNAAPPAPPVVTASKRTTRATAKKNGDALGPTTSAVIRDKDLLAGNGESVVGITTVANEPIQEQVRIRLYVFSC